MQRQVLIALALLAACKKEPATSGGSGTKGSGAPVAVAPLAAKDYFRVDAGPRTPCVAGQTCETRIVLSALGDYHVNEKYPFKFVVAEGASPGVAVDGTGTFALEDKKTGTLTVRFKPTNKGPATINGTFKLSVCTDENCQIESEKIALAVEAR